MPVPDKLHPGPGMSASDVAAHQSARIYRAMIEIVARRGYEAVKVHDLAHLAGVSSRAFYELFESKEDCFLQTQDLVTRRATRRVIASQAGERDWRQRPRLIFKTFVRELEDDPLAARFALIEAYTNGPAALEQARRNEATFAMMLAESFAREPGGILVPQLLVEGMMAGVAHVTRTRLLSGRGAELVNLDEEMTNWMLSYPGKSANGLAGLDLQLVWRDTRLQPVVVRSSSEEGEAWPQTGDRALILVSIAKLAVANGYRNLTVERIRRGAGVSRAIFKTHFEGVEDCFIAAMEQRVGEACVQAGHARTAGRTWSGGLYRAISALSDQVADDPLLAAVCLIDDFRPGSRGSRIRGQLVATVTEQLTDGAPWGDQPTALVTEASSGAVWALFHHHVVRSLSSFSPQISASMAFMALAPIVGRPAAVAAIAGEQVE
jgi:TetR/AcrR family transcriptional regulator